VAGAQPPDDRLTSVLLADDDERFRSLVRGLLEDDGYAVVAEACTAREAVRLAGEVWPDVAVLDLIMPWADGDGLDEAGLLAAEHIREQVPRARVVILSSLFDQRVRRRAEALGAVYVEKAAGVDALEQAMEAGARR
jgi:two-component system chemotaxis response regulator CheY